MKMKGVFSVFLKSYSISDMFFLYFFRRIGSLLLGAYLQGTIGFQRTCMQYTDANAERQGPGCVVQRHQYKIRTQRI